MKLLENRIWFSNSLLVVVFTIEINGSVSHNNIIITYNVLNNYWCYQWLYAPFREGSVVCYTIIRLNPSLMTSPSNNRYLPQYTPNHILCPYHLLELSMVISSAQKQDVCEQHI